VKFLSLLFHFSVRFLQEKIMEMKKGAVYFCENVKNKDKK